MNDSKMMDERGVEREMYSKEALSKSSVVHSSEITSMLKKREKMYAQITRRPREYIN